MPGRPSSVRGQLELPGELFAERTEVTRVAGREKPGRFVEDHGVVVVDCEARVLEVLERFSR